MAERGKNLGLMAIGVFLILVLVGAACAPGVEPGEGAKVVKIGNRVALTGALASTTAPVAEGNFDYVKYINEEHGGIGGVKVGMLWADCAALVPRTITAHRRLVGKGVVLEMDIISTPIETMAPTQIKDELALVAINPATVRMLTRPVPWIFPLSAGWGPDVAMVMKWVKDNWREARPPRFGLIFYDHASGWATLREGAERASSVGVDFVGYEVVPLLGTVDVSVELLRLAGKKPDWIYTTMYGATLMTTLGDSHRLELQKRGIKLCSSWIAVDEVYIRALPEAAEGWCVVRCVPAMWEMEQYKELELVAEAARKYRGRKPEQISSTYIAGWYTAKIAVEGVRLAIEKVGYENLTGRAVRDALASIENFDTGLAPPVTMTNDRPFLTFMQKIYQVQGGRVVPISDWLEPPFLIEAE